MRDIIQRLADLQPNWDSYGSPPIEKHALDKAGKFLDVCEAIGLPVPHVIPTSDGGIELEWGNAETQFMITIDPIDEEPTAWWNGLE